MENLYRGRHGMRVTVTVRELLEEIYDDTVLSFFHDKHPSFQAILAMGEEAIIPLTEYAIEAYQTREHHERWMWMPGINYAITAWSILTGVSLTVAYDGYDYPIGLMNSLEMIYQWAYQNDLSLS